MNDQAGFDIQIIGERINPGFKSTRALFDNEDIAGIQALAVKQADAGARSLNVNVGARALTGHRLHGANHPGDPGGRHRPAFLRLSERAGAGRSAWRPTTGRKANGALPIVNSITEHRWDLMDLYGTHGPFKVVLMASERVEDGFAKGNKSADEIYSTARRCALRLQKRMRHAALTTSSSTCR